MRLALWMLCSDLYSQLRFLFYMKNTCIYSLYFFHMVLIRFSSQLKFTTHFGICITIITKCHWKVSFDSSAHCNMLPFGFYLSQNHFREINHVTKPMQFSNMTHHIICYSERRFLHKPCCSLFSIQCLV